MSHLMESDGIRPKFMRFHQFLQSEIRILGIPGWSWPSLAGSVLAVSAFGLIALHLGLGESDIDLV